MRKTLYPMALIINFNEKILFNSKKKNYENVYKTPLLQKNFSKILFPFLINFIVNQENGQMVLKCFRTTGDNNEHL